MNHFINKLADKIGIVVQQGGTVNVGEINLDGGMSRQEFNNRKALLNNVRTAWVDGVLEKSLHEQISIVLGLESRPEAVASPWNIDLINPDQSRQVLPSGTPAIDVFDRLGEGGTLLILGEPGSGKTNTLLQLARDLINHAEQDIGKRIPVVLNLSSWAAEKLTIAKWIVEELNSKYQVNRKIGQQWVDKQELLLLLDGLDEIRDLEKRKACVVALNAFQQEQATEMVVCCRIKDYEELGNQLKLRSALLLQPLTSNQIQTYLDQLQSNVTALKIMLTQDETLQELAQSPLLLSMMVLAYQGIEVRDISVSAIASDRKRHLFEDYINRMFQGSRPKSYLPNIRTKEKQYYSRQNATHWLVWMAKQMIQHSQTIFLIEKMQFNYIVDSEQYFELYQDRLYRIFFVLENMEITWIKTNIEKLYNIMSGALFFLLLHLVVYIVFSLIVFQIIYQVFSGIWWLSAFNYSFGFSMFLFIYFFVFAEIKPVESVRFYIKWDKLEFKKILAFVLKYSPLLWFITSVIYLIGLGTCNKSCPRDLIHILSHIFVNVGLTSYFSCFLFRISFLGLTNKLELLKFGLLRIQVNTSEYPNQGIRKSAINAMFTGVFLSILCSIIYISLNVLLNMPLNSVLITVGLIVVFPFLLHYGGKASLQHLILRIILYFNRNIPWNYAKFLDWASDKLFLQKVGGGYIFIHRSLMEHFAEIENNQ